MKPAFKSCFVPRCINTTHNAPGKIFLRVPTGPERNIWCDMARRDRMSLQSSVYCCEDHFEPTQDIAEWYRHCFLKENGLPTFRLSVKKGVLPHIFDCQPDRSRAHSTPVRSVIEKRNRAETRRTALKAISDRNNNNKENESQNTISSFDTSTSATSKSQSFSWNEGTDLSAMNFTYEILGLEDTTVTESNITGGSDSFQRFEKSTITDSNVIEGSGSSQYLNAASEESQETVKQMDHIGTSADASSNQATDNVDSSALVTSCPTCGQKEPVETHDVSTSPIHFEEVTEAEEDEETVEENLDESIISESGSDSTYVPDEESQESDEGNDKENFTSEYTKELCLNLAIFRMERNPKQYLGLHPENLELLSHLETIAHVSKIESYIVLRKIRTDESFFFLADDCGFSISKVSRIFAKNLPIIAAYFKIFVYWPDKRNIVMTLPIAFRANYKDVVSIIDCFEIELEKPSDAINQSQAWSEYKKGNTAKYLLSCTPNGFINFISQGFGGRASDVTILRESEFLKKLPPNSVVMADRGFKEVESILVQHNCRLVRPPSVSEGVSMSKQEASLTKVIASLRIHVERVIKQVRETAFVDAHARFNHNFIGQLDNIVNLVCALSNLKKPLVK